MAKSMTCDGRTRRDFLRVGAAGATGLTLANYLRWSEAGEVKNAKANSAIFIHLGGGPSHIDSFDPKPEAPAEIRGEFAPLATKTPGLSISEHLPLLASQSDKYTVVRGVSHTLAAHDLGAQYMVTGNRPLPSLVFPGFGAVASKELVSPRDLPPFVAIPSTNQAAGYLGVAYAPFNTGTTPQLGRPFVVRGLAMTPGVTVTQVEKRQQLLERLDTAFAEHEQSDQLLRGLDRFAHQAHDIISSKRARVAFDVDRESASVRKRFGDGGFGQSCLLACRLVEAGVRFVTITFGGWDTHQQNFDRLKSKQLPELDRGLASLLETLSGRGLLDSTAVFMTGEFGRTPKINKNAGRDHYPRAMTVLMAGGGFAGGRVVGQSDKNGMEPAGEPITPDSLAATFYHVLGIDPHKEYHTSTGRPVMIVRDGKVMPELLG